MHPSLLILMGAVAAVGAVEANPSGRPAGAIVPVNIFVADDRQEMERAPPHSPYAAVGVITNRRRGFANIRFGTATLIGPCHVLTAHHTAFSRADDPDPDEPSLVHLGPPTDGFPFSQSVPARPVAWGDLGGHTNDDWAVLELEACAGDTWGWWEVEPMGLEEAVTRGPTFRSAGHPTAATRAAVTVDPACAIHGAGGSIPGWHTDCAVRVGDSGGPVFHLGEDGAPRLVAVIKGEFFPQPEVIPAWDDRATNVAIPVANFIDRIRPYLGR
jgi:V8-like Glu-specific endopeptidase